MSIFSSLRSRKVRKMFEALACAHGNEVIQIRKKLQLYDSNKLAQLLIAPLLNYLQKMDESSIERVMELLRFRAKERLSLIGKDRRTIAERCVKGLLDALDPTKPSLFLKICLAISKVNARSVSNIRYIRWDTVWIETLRPIVEDETLSPDIREAAVKLVEKSSGEEMKCLGCLKQFDLTQHGWEFIKSMEGFESKWVCGDCVEHFIPLFNELGLGVGEERRHIVSSLAEQGIVISAKHSLDAHAKEALRNIVTQLQPVPLKDAYLAFFKKWGGWYSFKEIPAKQTEKASKQAIFDEVQKKCGEAYEEHVQDLKNNPSLEKEKQRTIIWLTSQKKGLIITRAYWGNTAPPELKIAIGTEAIRTTAMAATAVESSQCCWCKADEDAIVLTHSHSFCIIPTWKL